MIKFFSKMKWGRKWFNRWETHTGECILSSVTRVRDTHSLLMQIILRNTYLIAGSETESTEEAVVGNVNKFAVVPPGYTGRPKKGHLIFDACFESGEYEIN